MEAIKLYAFADEACPSMDGQIQAMLRNRLDGLEIRNVAGTNVSDLTLDQAAQIRQQMDDHGLTVFSIGSPIGKIDICDPFEPHLDKLKHTLDIAQCLGAANIRMFSFYMSGDQQRHTDAVLERLQKFADAARGTGVTLCHENEKGIFGDIAQRCLIIHRNIPEIKAVFDPANFVQSGQNTLEAYALLKEHIHYMHIKDSLPDGNVVPAGLGAGNIPEIVADLRKNGKCCFTMEPHLTVFEGLAGLEREGETSGIGSFSYPDGNTAFDAAVKAFDTITGRSKP